MRGSNILDVFFINIFFEFGMVKCVDSLINIDYKSVIVNFRIRVKVIRKWVEFCDICVYCKLVMFDFLKGIDWLGELFGKNIDFVVFYFYFLINLVIDIFFFVKKIKVLSNDLVFVSFFVKYFLRKRNGFIKRGMFDEVNVF